MTEKRGVDPLDFTNLGEVDNPAKNEETKEMRKKVGLWPWIIGGALAFGGWWWWDKKKKAQALAKAGEAQLQVQTQPAEGKAKLGGNHPGLKIRGQEGFSAENRLRAILDQED